MLSFLVWGGIICVPALIPIYVQVSRKLGRMLKYNCNVQLFSDYWKICNVGMALCCVGKPEEASMSGMFTTNKTHTHIKWKPVLTCMSKLFW